MPEFILEGRNHAARAESAFILGYIEAMFFTESASGESMADWFSDETQEALRQGQLDGRLPADAGYTELHESALESIRADCQAFQAKAAELLELAYEAHWQRAALREGYRRLTHDMDGKNHAGFMSPDKRFIESANWQELCECEAIEPGESYDESQAGRDFWFTRNGHGVGYWDRPELEPDSIGDRLSALCGWKTDFPEPQVWFGDHVDNGNAPFVYHE